MCVHYSSLIDGYGKMGMLAEARATYDKMLKVRLGLYICMYMNEYMCF